MGIIRREPAGPAAARRSDAISDGVAAVLTYDGWLVGSIVHDGRRLSDALGEQRELGVLTADGLRRIDRDEVLMIAPPPLAPRPEMRVSKRQYPVAVDVGVARVRGTCHVLPGSTVWDTWRRSSSGFAPLTDVVLEFTDGSLETADVVLISRHVAARSLAMDPGADFSNPGVDDAWPGDLEWAGPTPGEGRAAAPAPHGYCRQCGAPRPEGARFCGGGHCDNLAS